VSAIALPELASRNARVRGGGYGPLARTPDQNGEEILALPRGFRYTTFSRTGRALAGGRGSVPRNPDGMACFPGRDGLLRLIRNHELGNRAGDMTLGVPHAGTPYDARAMGGTITVDFDPVEMRPLREFVSLCGTYANSAGGLAYRDAGWLSCEETTADARQGFLRAHGYTFLVPLEGKSSAVPLKEMGRFVKEAALADADRGIVYQTEDARVAGFYRFVPRDPDELARGGRLQMLKVSDAPGFNGSSGQAVGRALACEWVDLADPDPDLAAGGSTCFEQGRALGGAQFNRLEGLHRASGGTIYFTSTSGGEAQRGQLWAYRPTSADQGVVTLVYESTDSAVLDSPDNLCVTPRGGILLCEDRASRRGDTHALARGLFNVNRLIGMGPHGAPFEFSVNIASTTELAGACFSPDGEILFINIYGDGTPRSGMTCAIRGPWHAGPL
jgi:secreted PhoX family phosphatase